MVRPVLEVADILREHGPAWRETNRGHVSLDQLKVMSAIERCRTVAPKLTHRASVMSSSDLRTWAIETKRQLEREIRSQATEEMPFEIEPAMRLQIERELRPGLEAEIKTRLAPDIERDVRQALRQTATLARPIPRRLAIAVGPTPSSRRRWIASASIVDGRPL